jgi:branched-chain amino acid transport system substrate-binding protein
MLSIYSDISSPGAVAAAKPAIDDFGVAARGITVEIVGADMQKHT